MCRDEDSEEEKPECKNCVGLCVLEEYVEEMEEEGNEGA